jgi:hypothetical protein
MVPVEVSPGVVVVLAAWMLDTAACAGMEIGPPRAAVSALVVLHGCSSISDSDQAPRTIPTLSGRSEIDKPGAVQEARSSEGSATRRQLRAAMSKPASVSME